MTAPAIDDRFITQVARLYARLDDQIRDNTQSTGPCTACGNCCDFDAYGHRLFVTSPELLYLKAASNNGPYRPVTTGRCPYNQKGRCTIRDYRFAGCRIFYCRGDADFQSRLTETILARFKALCIEWNIPYRYTDLPAALNNTP